MAASISENYNNVSSGLAYSNTILPDLQNGASKVLNAVMDGGSYLMDQFAQADPSAQKWLMAGAGFAAGMVATNWLSKVPGFGMLGNGIVQIVAAAGVAIAASGMRVESAPASPQLATPAAAASITPDLLDATTTTASEVVRMSPAIPAPPGM